MPQREQAGGIPALAQAMEDVAQAEARAEAARVRALQLSQKAATDAEDDEGTGVEDSVDVAEPVSAGSLRRWRLRRPGRKSLAVGAAAMLIWAFLGTCGYVVWYHHKTVAERQHAAEFAEAARQGTITLMSIDANKARDDVQRIIDDSTGSFKTEMLLTAENLVKSIQESKTSTKAAVKAVAVESMTDDSAVVLVTAKAEVDNPDKSKPPPRSWRMVMTLQKNAGQIKVSQVEYLS
jgi:Mce-associated membrane protein